MRPIVFIAVALTLGLAYLVFTPPFAVPDENAHYWRSLALARGVALPPAERPAQLVVAHTHLAFVWYLTRPDPRQTPGARLRVAKDMRVVPTDRKTITYPAFYTPVPYAVQAIAALPGLWLHVRPVIVFYAGRAANLLAAVLLVALAMRVAPAASSLIAAVALLPMSLFLFASWSGDAPAIALSILLTALILRAITSPGAVTRREIVALVAVTLALSLCKTPYFLLALMILAVPRAKRVVIAPVLAAAIAGGLIALSYARIGYVNIRSELPIDPAAQVRCIAGDPVRFAKVLASDLATNASYYAESLVGRLGWNSLKLPRIVIVLELLLLLVLGVTSPVRLPGSARALAVTVVAATILAIVTGQYVIWTIICAGVVEGVQGRYFLPLAVLLLSALSIRSKPVPPWALITVSLVCNAIALLTLVRTAW